MNRIISYKRDFPKNLGQRDRDEFVNVVTAALLVNEHAPISHFPSCGTFMDEPCSCGLPDLRVALSYFAQELEDAA